MDDNCNVYSFCNDFWDISSQNVNKFGLNFRIGNGQIYANERSIYDFLFDGNIYVCLNCYHLRDIHSQIVLVEKINWIVITSIYDGEDWTSRSMVRVILFPATPQADSLTQFSTVEQLQWGGGGAKWRWRRWWEDTHGTRSKELEGMYASLWSDMLIDTT